MRKVAVWLFIVSAVSAVVLAIDAWRHREISASCTAAKLDTAALGIDTGHPEGITESWQWWPTGLSCHFPQIGGGYVTVPPGPLLSIVFLTFVAGFVAGLAVLVIRAVTRAS